MNKTQKGACYGILLSFVLAGIVVFDFLDTRVGWPVKLLVSAIWGGLLLGPVYLLSVKKGPREVEMDERDRRIVKRALLASFVLVAAALGVAFAIAILVSGPRGTLSMTMDDLSAVIYIILIAFVLVLSLAVLIQYGRGATDDKE